jgi:hypothetical protein
MRILVDEMPSSPFDCEYSDDEFACQYSKYGTHICENVKNCPYFKALNIDEIVNKVKKTVKKVTKDEIKDIIDNIESERKEAEYWDSD